MPVRSEGPHGHTCQSNCLRGNLEVERREFQHIIEASLRNGGSLEVFS